MSTLYAHIGSEKCGSSLIEYTFLNFRDMLIAMEKVGVVTTPQLHVALRKVVVGTQWDDGIHGRIRSQLLTPHRMTGKDVFMSEELMLGLMHEPGKPNPMERRIDFAQKMFRGFEKVHIILVVRRQDKFIESHYNQQVKRGETRDFGEVLDELSLDNYRWDVIADAWSEGFSNGSISVFPFEASIWAATDGPMNMLSAISQLMGINVNFGTKEIPVVNPSLRPDMLSAQRVINEEFDLETASRIADILSQHVLKVPGAAQGLFTPEARQQVLDHYAESNKRLFEKYIPQCSVDEYLSVTEEEK
tara:strand:- start:7826 stop:8734 length:909 start_codon:yes stop_codon:yes gene_type:complete